MMITRIPSRGTTHPTHYRIYHNSESAIYIAEFNSLDTAALVSRYICGAAMTDSEREEARAALKAIDEAERKQ